MLLVHNTKSKMSYIHLATTPGSTAVDLPGSANALGDPWRHLASWTIGIIQIEPKYPVGRPPYTRTTLVNATQRLDLPLTEFGQSAIGKMGLLSFNNELWLLFGKNEFEKSRTTISHLHPTTHTQTESRVSTK